MQVRLVCLEGASPGRVVELGPGSHLLGKEPPAAAMEPASSPLADRQAVVAVRPSAVLIADLESAAGTFVNGARLRIPTQLIDGDAVGFGEGLWRLTIVPDAAAPAAGPATAPGLEFLAGPRAGETVTLPEGVAFTIGRDARTDLMLDDPYVSRQHATLFRRGSQVTVLDNDSANGVRVNGAATRLAALQPGDELEIGRQKLRFATGPVAALEAGPAPDIAPHPVPPPPVAPHPVPPAPASAPPDASPSPLDTAPGPPPPEPAAAPAPIGRLGPYRLLAELGRGGMGRVFRAQRPGEPPVALKLAILKDLDLARANRRRRRFRREALVLRRIRHEHVVGYRDAGIVKDRPFLVMELLEGPDLSTELRRRGQLPYQEAERILFQLCGAVAAVHDAGVIHRDLKPANVILHGPERIVKLADFGIARPLDQDDLEGDHEQLQARSDLAVTGQGRNPGTLLYMSPEQVAGQAVDIRSDIWALGVVLYHLLTGQLPFPGPTGRDLMRQIGAAAPRELPESVPPAIRSAVYRCLLKPPGWRFSSARELMDALHERRVDQLFPVGERPGPARPITLCPRCQAGIAAGRSRCPACHADLQPFADGLLQQVIINGRALSGCGRCGQQVAPTATECPRCLTKFERRTAGLGAVAALTEAEAERLALGLARLRACPHCGSRVDNAAAQCSACGLLLRAFLLGRIDTRRAMDGEVLCCGACRHPLPHPDDLRCGGCGLDFETGYLPNGRRWQPPPRRPGTPKR